MDTVKIYLDFKMNNVIKYIDYLTDADFKQYIDLNILKNCIYESYKMYIYNTITDKGHKHTTKYEYSAVKGILRSNGFNESNTITPAIFNRIAASLYMGLRIDEKTVPESTLKLNLEDFLSHFIQSEFKSLLRGKKSGLNKLYNSIYKANNQFISNKTTFYNEYHILNSLNDLPIVLPKLVSNVPGLLKQKQAIINEAKDNFFIKKELFKITLRNVAFDCLKTKLSGINQLYLIPIYDDYIKTKSMLKDIIDILGNGFIKNNIILKFNYNQLNKYKEAFTMFKDLDIKIALEKSDLLFSNASLNYIDYAIVSFTTSDKFEEFIDSCNTNNTKTIIIAADNVEKISVCNEYKVNYYIGDNSL